MRRALDELDEYAQRGEGAGFVSGGGAVSSRGWSRDGAGVARSTRPGSPPRRSRACSACAPTIPATTWSRCAGAFGAGDLVELGSNENPYGPSPAAREAIARSAATRCTAIPIRSAAT